MLTFAIPFGNEGVHKKNFDSFWLSARKSNDTKSNTEIAKKKREGSIAQLV